MTSPAGVVVTADLLLQHLGIYEVLGTKELILRDEGVESIDEDVARDLVSLELLSLSHNTLHSLTNFEHFTSLIELNINFNQVTSLESLQITSIAPLRSFPKLVHVSVFGNLLADLEDTVNTCRHLTKLRSLDLDGNPCAKVKNYKYQTLRQLPRLKELDGETIQALDREMLLDQPPPSIRPSTAPPAPFSRRESTSLWTPSEDLRGPVNLFRDDFLNNNPILLEYLAQGATPRKEEEEPAEPLSRSSSFVDKMRLANPEPNAVNDQAPTDGSSTPRCPMAIPTALPTHAVVDPSDPKSTIRKLLKHIEQLTATIEAQKAASSDLAVDKLVQENERLRIENNNIPILQDEIQTLKRQLRHASEPQVSSPLEAENAALKREITKLRAIVAARPSESAPMTKEEILDQAACVDVELTALIMQNEISLEVMRQTIKKTKLEAQNERVARLTGQQRPNTSAGDRIITKITSVPTSPHRRMLHTSAGRTSSSSSTQKPFLPLKKSKPIKKSIPTVREGSDEEGEENNNNLRGPEEADVLVL